MRYFSSIFFMIILFVSLLISTGLYAQNKSNLQIKLQNSEQELATVRINYKKSFSSSKNRDKEVDKVLNQLYAQGYIAAQVDSTNIHEELAILYISLNNKYLWKRLGIGNIEESVINEIRFSENDYQNSSFNYQRLFSIEESIIGYYENHGYPFAKISMDSIEIQEGQISAVFNLTQGPLIHIDTLIIDGNVKINPKYIYRLLDIKPGDVYQEEKIKDISKQITSISFASESKVVQILFQEDQAQILLNLNREKTNTFDGIIGFQPNSGTDSKLILTGNLRLKLVNSFKRGELIELNWRSPGKGSQNIDLGFSYPFLLNSPVGLDYNFKLFKQDTNFINIRNVPGIRFIFNGSNYFKISADLFSSSTLTLDLQSGIPTNSNVLDMKSSLFTLQVHFVQFDYIFNPRRGWLLDVSGGYGNKNIIKQHEINPVFYDSIPLSSSQLKLSLHLEYFLPLFKRQTLRLANKSELLKGDYLLTNELFRIGGFSDLRGFDEEQIYASSYSIFTIEWRMLLERNSYINVFWNGAYVENNTGKTAAIDYPIGFGAGLNFETKAGIFALSYAMGTQNGNPIQFGSAKIHFGYIAHF